MLDLWRMRSTPLLPLLPGPLWPVVIAPDKGPIYVLNRTKRWLAFTVFFCFFFFCFFSFKLRIYAELNYLK